MAHTCITNTPPLPLPFCLFLFLSFYIAQVLTSNPIFFLYSYSLNHLPLSLCVPSYSSLLPFYFLSSLFYLSFSPSLFFIISYFHLKSSVRLEQRVSRIMGDSSASYIRMVQHLIERCLLFQMTKEECVEAISKHANIKPVITSTVWKELEKENKEFFEAYWQSREERKMPEMETTKEENIPKLLSDSSSRDADSDA